MSQMRYRPRPPKASIPRRRRRPVPAGPPPVPHTVQLRGRLSSNAERHLRQRSSSELARPRGSMGVATTLLLLGVVAIVVLMALGATGNL